MEETLILNAAVAVATVYENAARGSGKIFWNIVTDTKDRFTAFSRELVARLIDGQTPTVIKGRNGAPDSLAYNLNPPLNTMLFFEARVGPPASKVLVPTPAGTAEPPVTQPALPPGQPSTAPGSFQKQPYHTYGGGQRGKDWKPKDERPSLVTMTMAYAKDQVDTILAGNDMEATAPEGAIKWAEEQTLRLAKVYLNYCLTELTAMGVKLDPGEGGGK
jgi:hypothetical protein